MSKLILNRAYWWLPIFFWTALVLLSLAWNLADTDKHRQELVTNRARFIFKMVESVRLWNANHGGVYAQVDANTPPNPHIVTEERDILTPSGRNLTLVNPAYMTRQLASVVNDMTGVLIHITSLKPINPGNKTAPWEAAALKHFEEDRKNTEWSDFSVDGNGKEQFRYIAPLVTMQPCLKCHESQGYKVGDIRGGIGITFPPGPLVSPIDGHFRSLIAIHLGVLLLLIALTLLFLKHLRLQILALEAARAEQEHLVEQRTSELRYEAEQHQHAVTRLRSFIESSGEAIFVIDNSGRFTLCNPAALKLLGYADENTVLGMSVHELLCTSPDRDKAARTSPCDDCAIYHCYSSGIAQHREDARFRCANGAAIPVEYRSQPLQNGNRVTGAVITFADISERLAREQQLRKLSKALEYSPVAALITDQTGHIEYVNHQCVEACGYTEEELLGNTPGLLKSGNTPSSTYEALWSQLSRGEPWHGELLNRKKNGELFWEDTAIAPITDESGKIVNYVAFKEDITQRKEEEKRVWQQANFDSLTGLPNRSHFFDQLKHHTKEAQRYHRKFALMFLDLDGFKQVNDSLGHDAGDELLRQCAQRLTKNTRSSDIVSRLGGDEFTVIIPSFESIDDIMQVAQKLIEEIAQPYRIKDHEVRISASLGIAAFPSDTTDSDMLFKMADTAMYAAKHAGKNRFRIFSSSQEEVHG